MAARRMLLCLCFSVEFYDGATVTSKSFDEDIELPLAPTTEQIMDARIKTINLPDVNETDDSWMDPNWDRRSVVLDVAYYLRAHKFHDYDRRYYTYGRTNRYVDSRLKRKKNQNFPRAETWKIHRIVFTRNSRDRAWGLCIGRYWKIVIRAFSSVWNIWRASLGLPAWGGRTTPWRSWKSKSGASRTMRNKFQPFKRTARWPKGATT